MKNILNNLLNEGYKITLCNYDVDDMYPYNGMDYVITSDATRLATEEEIEECNHYDSSAISFININDEENFPEMEDILSFRLSKDGEHVCKEFNVLTFEKDILECQEIISNKIKEKEEHQRKEAEFYEKLEAKVKEFEENEIPKILKMFKEWEGGAKSFYQKYIKKYYNYSGSSYPEGTEGDIVSFGIWVTGFHYMDVTIDRNDNTYELDYH